MIFLVLWASQRQWLFNHEIRCLGRQARIKAQDMGVLLHQHSLHVVQDKSDNSCPLKPAFSHVIIATILSSCGHTDHSVALMTCEIYYLPSDVLISCYWLHVFCSTYIASTSFISPLIWSSLAMLYIKQLHHYLSEPTILLYAGMTCCPMSKNILNIEKEKETTFPLLIGFFDDWYVNGCFQVIGHFLENALKRFLKESFFFMSATSFSSVWWC